MYGKERKETANLCREEMYIKKKKKKLKKSFVWHIIYEYAKYMQTSCNMRANKFMTERRWKSDIMLERSSYLTCATCYIRISECMYARDYRYRNCDVITLKKKKMTACIFFLCNRSRCSLLHTKIRIYIHTHGRYLYKFNQYTIIIVSFWLHLFFIFPKIFFNKKMSAFSQTWECTDICANKVWCNSMKYRSGYNICVRNAPMWTSIA